LIDYKIHHGDCLDTLRGMADSSVDSIVTDPPYGLSKQPDMAEVLRHWLAGDDYIHTGGGFMGKSWDSFVPGPSVWREVLRVLKPGGYALVFAGSRTQDLMSMALRLAGFEIRDTAFWFYGSGFPKSLDVSKAVDKSRGGARFDDIRAYLRNTIKQAGVTHADIKRHLEYPEDSGVVSHWVGKSQPSLPLWRDWQKMKEILPLDGRYDELLRHADREVIGQKKSGIANKAEGPRHTIGAGVAVEVDITTAHTDEAKQWEGWGTALKPAYEPIIIARKPLEGTVADNVLTHGVGAINVDGCRIGDEMIKTNGRGSQNGVTPIVPQSADYVGSEHHGRWPANILHDGCFDDEPWGRYFYCAKASKADRNEGCDHLAHVAAGEVTGGRAEGSDGLKSPRAGAGRTGGARNHHPTVKPTELMRWCCRLVTPPGGTVLDPFAGSGSTGKAALLEGFNPVLCEREAEYLPIIEARCAWALFKRVTEE